MGIDTAPIIIILQSKQIFGNCLVSVGVSQEKNLMGNLGKNYIKSFKDNLVKLKKTMKSVKFWLKEEFGFKNLSLNTELHY